MINTLDEAIMHERKVTENLKEIASTISVANEYYTGKLSEYLDCIAEHEQLVAWLEELAERREADRWIPVSERLPEYSGLYLVSFCDLVTVANFTGTKFTDRSIISNTTTDVIAWRPLPEVYKESEVEND